MSKGMVNAEKVEGVQPMEQIENLIVTVRDKQVMLDRDLARLYGVDTKVLNQAVKRNIERFPADFMFQLTKDEYEVLRSQSVAIEHKHDVLRSKNVTIDMRGRHVKYMPNAFTENGVAGTVTGQVTGTVTSSVDTAQVKKLILTIRGAWKRGGIF